MKIRGCSLILHGHKTQEGGPPRHERKEARLARFLVDPPLSCNSTRPLLLSSPDESNLHDTIAASRFCPSMVTPDSLALPSPPFPPGPEALVFLGVPWMLESRYKKLRMGQRRKKKGPDGCRRKRPRGIGAAPLHLLGFPAPGMASPDRLLVCDTDILRRASCPLEAPLCAGLLAGTPSALATTRPPGTPEFPTRVVAGCCGRLKRQSKQNENTLGLAMRWPELYFNSFGFGGCMSCSESSL